MVFEGSKVKESVVLSDLIKWRYPMKVHSLCYKMVCLILKIKQKWESYSEFNSSGSSKNGEKNDALMALTGKPYNVW